jgi:hypothetical protein
VWWRIGSIAGWGKPGKVAGPAGLRAGEAVGPCWATMRAVRKGGMGGQAGPAGMEFGPCPIENWKKAFLNSEPI